MLLKNDDVLPLADRAEIGLYGFGSMHTVHGGTGSGSVNCCSGVTIREGLENAEFRITSAAWLDRYESAYRQAYTEWIQMIYLESVPDGFDSLYQIHASHPMAALQASPIAHRQAGNPQAAEMKFRRLSA